MRTLHDAVRFPQKMRIRTVPNDAEVDLLTIGAIQTTAMTPDSTVLSDPVSDPGPDGSKGRKR